MDIQLSFIELRQKEVINVCDGKRLGRIIDIVFDLCGKICGVVVPGPRRFFWWRSCEDIFIPWRKIDKIGSDVILVDLEVRHRCREDEVSCAPRMPERPPNRHGSGNHNGHSGHRDKGQDGNSFKRENNYKEYITQDYVLHKTGKESLRYQDETEEDYFDDDEYPNPMVESR